MFLARVRGVQGVGLLGEAGVDSYWPGALGIMEPLSKGFTLIRLPLSRVRPCFAKPSPHIGLRLYVRHISLVLIDLTFTSRLSAKTPGAVSKKTEVSACWACRC